MFRPQVIYRIISKISVIKNNFHLEAKLKNDYLWGKTEFSTNNYKISISNSCKNQSVQAC